MNKYLVVFLLFTLKSYSGSGVNSESCGVALRGETEWLKELSKEPGFDSSSFCSVHAEDGFYAGTLLYLAARNGHLETVRTLMDLDSRASKFHPSSGTPLAAAALKGHVEVVRLLLERGVSPELGFMTQTVLEAVIEQPYSESMSQIIALLLKYGAESSLETVMPQE